MMLLRVLCTATLLAAPSLPAFATPDDRYVSVSPMQATSGAKKSARGRVRATIPATEGFASAGPATGFATSSLAATAQQYVGRNPTGMGRRWCGAFMKHVVRKSGLPDNPAGNLSRSWASYGRPAAPGTTGAIAVMRGHVGIVTGTCERGYQVLSGNHNRTTGYGCYSASRIIAWRMPS
jgi:hypothetical protein